jgi:[protein-PII] uridylyltransferase
VIEVQGRDRPGFLYDVTYALFSLSLSISTARIATYGERAVDVFYVKDLFGLKVTQKNKLAAIEQRLLTALRPPWERGAAETTADEAESAEKPAVRGKRRPRGAAAAE